MKIELLRKQSVTDGRTHGRTDARTDGRTDNVKTVYPLQTKFAGGIINKFVNMSHLYCLEVLITRSNVQGNPIPKKKEIAKIDHSMYLSCARKTMFD